MTIKLNLEAQQQTLQESISGYLVSSDFNGASRTIEALKAAVPRPLYAALMALVRFEEDRRRTDAFSATGEILSSKVSESAALLVRSIREYESWAPNAKKEMVADIVAYTELMMTLMSGSKGSTRLTPLQTSSRLLTHLSIAANHMVAMHRHLDVCTNAISGHSTWFHCVCSLHAFVDVARAYLNHKAVCEGNGKSYDMGPEPSLVELYGALLAIAGTDPVVTRATHRAVQLWVMGHFIFGRVIRLTDPKAGAHLLDDIHTPTALATPKRLPGARAIPCAAEEERPWYYRVLGLNPPGGKRSSEKHSGGSVGPDTIRRRSTVTVPEVALMEAAIQSLCAPRKIHNYLTMVDAVLDIHPRTAFYLLVEAPLSGGPLRFGPGGYHPSDSEADGGSMRNWDIALAVPHFFINQPGLLVSLVAQATILKSSNADWKVDYDSDKLYVLVKGHNISPRSYLCATVDAGLELAKKLVGPSCSDALARGLQKINDAWVVP